MATEKNEKLAKRRATIAALTSSAKGIMLPTIIEKINNNCPYISKIPQKSQYIWGNEVKKVILDTYIDKEHKSEYEGTTKMPKYVIVNKPLTPLRFSIKLTGEQLDKCMNNRYAYADILGTIANQAGKMGRYVLSQSIFKDLSKGSASISKVIVDALNGSAAPQDGEVAVEVDDITSVYVGAEVEVWSADGKKRGANGERVFIKSIDFGHSVAILSNEDGLEKFGKDEISQGDRIWLAGTHDSAPTLITDLYANENEVYGQKLDEHPIFKPVRIKVDTTEAAGIISDIISTAKIISAQFDEDDKFGKPTFAICSPKMLSFVKNEHSKAGAADMDKIGFFEKNENMYKSVQNENSAESKNNPESSSENNPGQSPETKPSPAQEDLPYVEISDVGVNLKLYSDSFCPDDKIYLFNEADLVSNEKADWTIEGWHQIDKNGDVFCIAGVKQFYFTVGRPCGQGELTLGAFTATTTNPPLKNN